jgi:hypothetical protein
MADSDRVERFFQELDRRGHEPLLERMQATGRVELYDGGRTEHWLLAVRGGYVTASRSEGPLEADWVMRADRRDFERVIHGDAGALAALIRGTLSVETGGPEPEVGSDHPTVRRAARVPHAVDRGQVAQPGDGAPGNFVSEALGQVTILDGNTFVVSDAAGDIEASPVDATDLFVYDTRFLSQWVLTTVRMDAACDFADLFEIKNEQPKKGRRYQRVEEDRLILGYQRETFHRSTIVTAALPAAFDDRGLTATTHLPPGGRWTGKINVEAVITLPDEGNILPRWRKGHEQMSRNLERIPTVLPALECDWQPLKETYRRSLVDLAALRFSPQAAAGGALPAAGLPWFMSPLLRKRRRHAPVSRAARRVRTVDRQRRPGTRGRVRGAGRVELDRRVRRPHRPRLRRVPATERSERAGEPVLEGLAGRHLLPRRPDSRSAARHL